MPFAPLKAASFKTKIENYSNSGMLFFFFLNKQKCLCFQSRKKSICVHEVKHLFVFN